MTNYTEGSKKAETFDISHFVVRLIVGSVVLAITAFLTPNFSITGFWPLLFGAIALAGLDYFVLKALGINATPFGRGLTGFITAAIIIYTVQFFIVGFEVSLLGAVIGAFVYGIVDAIVPGRAM